MTAQKQNYFRTSIKALIFDEQKRFLMFREDSGYWDLPGGGLDFGESPRACLTRELEEEAGLQISSVAARPAYFASGLNLEKIWKTIICYKTSVKHLNFRPSKECQEIRFFY